MGFGDALRDGILNATGLAPVKKAIDGATSPGTTSGIDAAMQAHADQQHPVGAATKPGKIKQWGEQ